ncbi:MAG: hypothetical protein CL424_01100 [Acidimicrobiaceae bacterium]|nr:hypothetical protein [Acidimicrobiaceae bacterium]
MAVDIASLEVALRASWQSDTSDAPDLWTATNPARGQCAVTAKVVQDYFGGTLVIAAVLRDGEPVEKHCWNVLPSGEHVDLTAVQFDFDYVLGEPVEQEPIVDHTGVNRHLLLASRVADHLSHP